MRENGTGLRRLWREKEEAASAGMRPPPIGRPVVRRGIGPRVRRVRRLAQWLAILVAVPTALAQFGKWVPALDPINAFDPILLPLALLCCIMLAVSGPLWSPPLLLAIVCAGLSGERIAYELRRPIPQAPALRGREITIVTYNVFRGNQSPGDTLALLMNSGADVILLQEASGKMRPVMDRLRTAYPYGPDCTSRPCDYVLFSRYPLSRQRYRFRDAQGRQTGPGLVQARLTMPGMAPFTLATLHLSRPEIATTGEEGKSTGIGALAQAARRTGDPRLIVAGDFNMVPWSFQMKRLDAMMEPMTRATRAAPTYPGMGLVPRFMPIDHVYAGPGWLVRDVAVLPASGSDHRAVRVVLDAI